MKKVVAIQTVYEHWSKFSGYHGFIPHLSDNCKVELIRIKHGTNWFCDFPIIKKFTNHLIESTGLSFYSPNDLRAEINSILRVILSDVSVLHFLDGEHGYALCASLLNRISPRIRKKIRIIASFHLPPFRLRTIFKRTNHLNFLDRVVLVGTNQLNFFREHIQDDFITVLPHGVNTDFYCPLKNKMSGDRDQFVCLTVGYHLRDYELLLKVAESLKEYPHIQFRIISSAEALKHVRLKNVQVSSNVSDNKLLEAYRQADLLTMPLTDCTANNVILEAFATGLPVLTTDVGGVRDYFIEGCGELLSSNSVKEFAEAILSLAQNKSLLQEMGQKARRVIEKRFDWKKLAPQYERLYV